MGWYVEVLKKYVVFEGRARRKEYWYFALISFIISFIFSLIDTAIVTQEIFQMIVTHEGSPIELKYTFEDDGQVYVEIKEVSQEGGGNKEE